MQQYMCKKVYCWSNSKFYLFEALHRGHCPLFFHLEMVLLGSHLFKWCDMLRIKKEKSNFCYTVEFPLDINFLSPVGQQYVQNSQLSLCLMFLISIHFLPFHLLLNIPTILPLSAVVYPPSACPLLAKALISRTLSILQKSSHSLPCTSYIHSF